MVRKASMTTLPRTDWIGSITTATARGLSCSNDYGVKRADESGGLEIRRRKTN